MNLSDQFLFDKINSREGIVENYRSGRKQRLYKIWSKEEIDSQKVPEGENISIAALFSVI